MTFRSISYLGLASVFLAGCGGGGGAGTSQSSPEAKSDQPAKPAITFTATPLSINQGSSATLAWTSSNATSVSIDNGIGNVGLSDSRQITPAVNTTYIATATGPGGSASASVAITVVPRPTITVAVDPSTVRAGQTATITWNSSNATSVTFDNGIGSVAASGSRTVTPSRRAGFGRCTKRRTDRCSPWR